uniref:Decapping nuclease n=1 Tax=Rhabditophanes sp. KR3021 TaxID=114890 RepID=A0AC35TY45_9BILA
MWPCFVKSKPNDKPTDLRCDLGDADIVTWRGFLKNIGLLALNDFKADLRILAQKYNNVIFLEEYPKPNQTSQMEDHKGHMFENFITENANGESNENNTVDTSNIYTIVQTRIFTDNGKDTTVCYTAEVDALKHKAMNRIAKTLNEIKEQFNDTDTKFVEISKAEKKNEIKYKKLSEAPFVVFPPVFCEAYPEQN